MWNHDRLFTTLVLMQRPRASTPAIDFRQRKEQLFKRAQLFLAEEAMRFAVALAAIQHLPKTGDSREVVRVKCKVRYQ